MVLVFCSTIGAFAAEIKQPIKIVYEYEMYKELKLKTDLELKEMGMNDEQVKELRNTDYIKEIKKRANLDSATLKFMGYSDQQIDLLKNTISNSTNLADEQLMAVSSEFSFYAWLMQSQSTDSYISVGFYWNWNTMPVIYGFNDMLAVMWDGSDSQGYPLNVQIDTSISHVDLYHHNNNSAIGDYTTNTNFTVDEAYRKAHRTFQEGYRWEDTIDWVYYGDGTFRVKKIGTTNIASVAINFKYGHNTLILAPNFTNTGLTIKFTNGIINMGGDYSSYTKTTKTWIQ